MTGVLAEGSQVGRYKVVGFLGAGAMGEVYLAVDPHIERRLAIKTVRLAGGRPQDIEDRKKRLLREARAAGRLLHPNVVTLFDAGEHEGLLYLAFEFVEGSDLSARIEAGPPLSLGEILRIVSQAAGALDFAHQAGIVHRDIKPSNILLDEIGKVKVADFGIAKVAGQNTELTVSGSVMGSPQYLSPEQIRGDDLDGRSDIFSLGVVLYELLSGRRPFSGETLTTLVYQILQHEPPPISALRAVPPRLERLLARMMAKDREARFASAREVADEVAALERELPREVLAAPVGLAAEQLDETHLLPPRAEPGAAPPPPPPMLSGSSGSVPPPLPSAPARVPTMLERAPWDGLPAPPPPPRMGTAPLTQPTPPTVLLPATGPSATVPPPQAAPPIREGKGGLWLILAGVALLMIGVVAAGGYFLWQRFKGELSPSTSSDSANSSLTSDAAVSPPISSPDPKVIPALPSPSSPAPKTVVAEKEPPASPALSPSPAPVKATPVREPAPYPSAPPPTSPRTPPTSVPPSAPVAPAPEPPVRRPAPPEPEREAPRRAPEPSGPVTRTGLSLLLRVSPPDAYVLLDGKVIGQAKEYNGRPYRLPGADSYVLKFKRDGYQTEAINIEASEVGGTTPIPVGLRPLAAAKVETGDLPRYQTQSMVSFRISPDSAMVSIDGAPPIPVRTYRGGLGRSGWLELPVGRHRLSFTADGRSRRDVLVEVGGGAEDDKKKIELNLPPGGDG